MQLHQQTLEQHKISTHALSKLRYNGLEIRQNFRINKNSWLEHTITARNFFVLNKVISSQKSNLINLTKTEKFSIPTQGVLNQNIADIESNIVHFQTSLREQYGFESAVNTWKLSQATGIDGLLNLIKENGYLMAGGHFGQYFHNKLPELKQDSNFSYHFWSKSSFVSNPFKPTTSHAIIVIGACKKSKANKNDLVFFIDPANDFGSDSYRVFALSYEDFVERLACEHPILKGHPILKHSICTNPQLKPTEKPAISNTQQSSFWQMPDCATITKLVITAATVAVSYALTRNTPG
jgi:hypothetical protein